MEETYKNYNTKCLYFKDRFGNYQPLGEPENVEYNKYICYVPTLEIKINNPKNVEQYMLESYGRHKKEEINLRKVKEKVELPERYIINENATILFWKNGEKTVVKRCTDDAFNPRLAFLTAFFQRYADMSKNKANKYLASLQVEVEPKQNPKHMKEENKKYVKIIEDGECFNYYDTWIKKHFPQFTKHFKEGKNPIKNKTYEIVGKAKHEWEEYGTLYLIQDPENKQVFIMSERGIKEDK